MLERRVRPTPLSHMFEHTLLKHHPIGSPVQVAKLWLLQHMGVAQNLRARVMQGLVIVSIYLGPILGTSF